VLALLLLVVGLLQLSPLHTHGSRVTSDDAPTSSARFDADCPLCAHASTSAFALPGDERLRGEPAAYRRNLSTPETARTPATPSRTCLPARAPPFSQSALS